MWAQIIKGRSTPENFEKIRAVQGQIRSLRGGAGGGLVRAYTLRNQKDSNQYYNLVIFESEEKARESEGSPEMQQLAAQIRDLIDGQPEFVDLEVVEEFTP